MRRFRVLPTTLLVSSVALLAAGPGGAMTMPVGDARVFSFDANGDPVGLGDAWTMTRSGGIFPTFTLSPDGGPRFVRIRLDDGTDEVFRFSVTPDVQQLVPLQLVAPLFQPFGNTQGALADVSAALQLFVIPAAAGPVQLLDPNTVLSYDPPQFRYTLDGQEFVLDVVAVPEPATFLLVSGGLVLLAGLRRRSHSSP